MTPEEYCEKITAPTIREYLGDSRNPRRAMLACMTIIHLHDALKHIGKRAPSESTTAFFESLRVDCPECWTVYLVGIAAKHIKQDKTGFHIDSVIERPPAVYGEAVYDLSRWDDAVGGVEAVTLKASVDDAVVKAFEFLTKRFLSGTFSL